MPAAYDYRTQTWSAAAATVGATVSHSANLHLSGFGDFLKATKVLYRQRRPVQRWLCSSSSAILLNSSSSSLRTSAMSADAGRVRQESPCASCVCVTPQIVHRRPVNESHGGQRAQTLRNDGFVVGVPPILPAIQILTMVLHAVADHR